MTHTASQTLFLDIPRPVAWVLSYGLFRTLASPILLLAIDSMLKAPGTCRCLPSPTYFHTTWLLAGILGSYVGLSLVQNLYLLINYAPAEGMHRWQPGPWLFSRSLCQGLPFFMMLISLAALPDYQLRYFLAGVIALPICFALSLCFKRYAIRFANFKSWWSNRFMKWVIISFIAYVGFFLFLAPGFVACDCRMAVSSVTANMHTLQTMVETYAVDWGGVYPPSLKALEEEGKVPGREFWKKVNKPNCNNTLDDQRALLEAEQADLIRFRDILGFRFDLEPGTTRCMVLYHSDSVSHYVILGTDENGRLIRVKGNKVMVLSNS